ncbi:glycosyltransferase family 39 protein [Streptomyces sp. LX-29]|uniref:glycosyltransferase family 39 protein n=1 Tax=Streptomyces sp. LX-29 TaxID=2900152 RepID=UPI00240D125C|nr:glycosyltransferase family 39 protein [Streptomyces sp. LX-29]WFB09181.1 glycosyltransferase family 39 protein [Streptomyces sp. LX-29]
MRFSVRVAVGVLAPMGVMLALGLWGLDRGAMWRDESATYLVARRTLPEIWRLLGTVDAVHGLYYLLMHGVLAAGRGLAAPVGDTETLLRAPSLLAAVGTAGLVAALGHRLTGRARVGLWAGLLYAATPIVSHYAQEGRPYALVATGAAAATLLLVRAAERHTAGGWAGYGAVVAVTVLLNACAALLLVAHAATLALAHAPRRTWRGWAAAAVGVVAVLAPLLLVSAGQADQVAWIAEPRYPQAKALLYGFAGPSGLVLAVNLALMGVALARPLPPATPLPLPAVALPLALVPPLLLFAASQQEALFHPRYVFFALAGVPLLAAAGAEWLASRMAWRRPVALVGAAAIGLAFLWQFPLHQRERALSSRADNLAVAAAELGRVTRPGDAVLYAPAYERRLALAYPRPVAHLRDVALQAPGPPSGTLYGREVGRRELARRLAPLDRVWLVSEPGPPHGPKPTALAARGFRPGPSLCLADGKLTLYTKAPR